MCVFSAVIKPASGNIISGGGGMKKDIELLEELKGRLVEKMGDRKQKNVREYKSDK